MTDAQIKTWFEIVETGLKSLAIIGAGIWAVALHLLLLRRERAQAGLRKTEAEIRDLDLKAKHAEAQTEAQIRGLDVKAKHTEAEIRDLELKGKQQAVVRVDIHPTVHRAPEGSGYLILTTVDLTNRGTRNTRITWRDQPPAFYVREARFHADGTPDFDKLARELRVPLTLQPDQEPKSHVIRAGGTESIPFAIRVATPGLYLLSFRGIVDEEERKVSANTGVELPVSWTGSSFVLVPCEQPDPGA